MPFYLKISLSMFGVMFLASSLIVFESYMRYSGALDEIVRDRFSVVGDHLEDVVASGLRLGLSIKEIQTTPRTLQSIKKSDPEILSMQVFELVDGALGKTVFSTRKVSVGNSVPNFWVQTMLSADKGRSWSFREGNTIVLGKNIYNMFDSPIGASVVRFTIDLIQGKLGEALKKMLLLLSGFALLSGGVLILGCMVSIRQFSISLKKISKTIRLVLRDEEQHSFKASSPSSSHSLSAQLSCVLLASLEIRSRLNDLKQVMGGLKVQDEAHE